MRPTLVVVIVVVFVALLTIDPVACVDGCREDAGNIAPAATTACVICLGLGPVVKFFAVTPSQTSLPSVTAPALLSEPVLTHPIEHPPRNV